MRSARTGARLPARSAMDDRREADVFLRHKLGHRVPVCVRVAPITDDSGRIIGAVEVFSDVSAKVQVERRVHELEGIAFRDSLTCLPESTLHRTESEAIAGGVSAVRALVRLANARTLDHFKQVNDLHGHDAGDAILKAVSDTLAKSVREDDVVGRWGGEEFFVLLADVNGGTVP